MNLRLSKIAAMFFFFFPDLDRERCKLENEKLTPCSFLSVSACSFDQPVQTHIPEDVSAPAIS